MNNNLKIIGDCYKKFGLKHTSNSQNTIPEDIRFLKYIVMTEKERSKLPSNCSFDGGKLVHEIVQSALCNNKTVDEVIGE